MEKFQSFWHGETLPEHVITCMKSFLYYGHQFELYSYGKPVVPNGVALRDAGEIINEEELFFYSNEDGSRGSVSAFSNLFRYELLHKRGNWWVDTDVLCLSNIVPQYGCFWGWEDGHHINGAILKIPKENALLGLLLENSKAAGKQVYWGQIGPRLITKLVKELHIENTAFPSHFAYPLHWDEYPMLVDPEAREELQTRLKGLPFLHLWNEKFRLDQKLSLDDAVENSYWHVISSFYKNFDRSLVEGFPNYEARVNASEKLATELLKTRKSQLEPQICELRTALTTARERIQSLENEILKKDADRNRLELESLASQRSIVESEQQNRLAHTLIEHLSRRIKALEQRQYSPPIHLAKSIIRKIY